MAIRILKTLVGSADEGSIWKIDTIEYDGGLWLVPQWLEVPSEGVTMPARIIPIDVLPHQKTEQGPADYLLTGPLPKSVLDGKTTTGYVVVERPDIKIPAGGKLQ